VTPGGGEQFEAIAPEKPSVASTDTAGGSFPRPMLVAEALCDVDGANDILEFLGQLLNPDPEQRPSATEAMAHHFLRLAQAKAAGRGGDQDEAGKKTKVNFKNGGKNGASQAPIADGKIARKGTGFVHATDLPGSSDEEEDEESEERPAQPPAGKVQFKPAAKAAKADGEQSGKIARKGTGYVYASELPVSDDEDDEDEEEAAPVKEKKVKMAPATSSGSKASDGGKIARKGTGYVHASELPVSDDEEDEEDEPAPKAKGVGFKVGAGAAGEPADGKIARKGTGFVHVSELPPSDDEDEEEEEDEPAPKKVQISPAVQATSSGGGMTRKGTGFVHPGELPQSDDEEDSDEEPKAAPQKKVQVKERAVDLDKKKNVPVKEDGKMVRKGTGYVHVSELPPSDDEDEEDEEENPSRRVHIKEPVGGGGKKSGNGVARKGTGFVLACDLPDDDEDDEDEEEDDPQPEKKTHFSPDSVASASKKAGSSKPVRKGTGFVSAADLPDSDEEEDEDEEETATEQSASGKTVNFKIGEGKSVAKVVSGESDRGVRRKGTGFVRASDLIGTEESDEDEDED